MSAYGQDRAFVEIRSIGRVQFQHINPLAVKIIRAGREMKFFWLASFGKSGNTWLRFLIYQYLHGKCTNPVEVEEYLPFVNRISDISSIPADQTLISKTHYFWDPDKHPFADKTQGFIYMVRNPRDVMLSYVNHYQLKNQIDEGEKQFCLNFIEHGGVPELANVQGPWDHHVQSWKDCSHPNLFIKYEDMLDDPEKTFAQVVTFMNLDYFPEKLRDAVKWSSFEHMKALEEEAKTSGNEFVSIIFTGGANELENGHAFVNKGRSGQTLDHLGADLEPAFIKRFGEAMKSLGYI
jgi:hypothetical protein